MLAMEYISDDSEIESYRVFSIQSKYYGYNPILAIKLNKKAARHG